MTHEAKRPTHTAYCIHGEGTKGRWRKIGVAWTTKDDKGLILQLDCLSRDGRVVLREAEWRAS
jgi:hypothetical protein